MVALGSPGGATIITTVLQTLTGFLDRGLPLVDAIAAPRASQRNAATTELEPGLWNSPLRGAAGGLGHAFRQNPEIGAATGVQRLPDGRWLAAAEKVRRGGGSAMVVHPGSGETDGDGPEHRTTRGGRPRFMGGALTGASKLAPADKRERPAATPQAAGRPRRARSVGVDESRTARPGRSRSGTSVPRPPSWKASPSRRGSWPWAG